MFYHHFSLQFLHVSQFFLKRIRSNLHIYSNLKLDRSRKTEYCETESLLQKAVIVLQLLFCESNHFCNKTSFCNIICKRILSTFHDSFERIGVKINAETFVLRFCGSLLEEYDENEILFAKATLRLFCGMRFNLKE